MTIQTFRAKSMKEALVRVRDEMGADAVILNTREVRGGGFLGFARRAQVEVTASRGLQVPPRRRAAPSLATRRAEILEAAYGQQAAARPRAPEPDGNQPVFEQLNSIRTLVEDLVEANRRQQAPEVPECLFQTYTHLIENEVSQELAQQLVRTLRDQCSTDDLSDSALLDRLLTDQVESMLEVSGPTRIEPGTAKVIALVGPTGVGKTTTIAKLAAIFKLRQGARVGLVTVDTYRIAAVDQLRRYAEIIDVPLEVVTSAAQMKPTIRRMRKEADVVLIDTAGRSPRDELRIGELRSVMQKADVDEIHLVLSLVASEGHLLAAIDKFGIVGGDYLIVTKLDEAMTYGTVLSMLARCRRQLSYVTTGQVVPEDIEAARKDRLARLILGKEAIHG